MRFDKGLLASSLVALVGLAWFASTKCFPVMRSVVVPVLRYHDAIYTGCAVGQDIRDGRILVQACLDGETLTDADRIEGVVVIQRDEPGSGAVVPLAEGHALYLDGQAQAYRLKGADPGRRLAARVADHPVLLLRHPVSDAHTLAQVLKADGFLLFNEKQPPGYLQIERLYDQVGKATIIEDPKQLAPIVREALAAPVSWRAQTSGEPYTVTLILSNGNPARFTYYPAADLLIYHLHVTDMEVVGIPLRAPSHFRDQLKAALR